MKSEFAALRRRCTPLSLSQVFDAGIFIYLGIRSTISVDRIGVERNLALSLLLPISNGANSSDSSREDETITVIGLLISRFKRLAEFGER